MDDQHLAIVDGLLFIIKSVIEKTAVICILEDNSSISCRIRAADIYYKHTMCYEIQKPKILEQKPCPIYSDFIPPENTVLTHPIIKGFASEHRKLNPLMASVNRSVHKKEMKQVRRAQIKQQANTVMCGHNTPNILITSVYSEAVIEKAASVLIPVLSTASEQVALTEKIAPVIGLPEESFLHLVCKKGYQTSGTARIHPCPYCEKIFKISTNNQRHTGERPYLCKHCNKSFAQVISKQIHERTHTGEKPFKCTFCDKTFATATNKRTHERIHKPIKPYICCYCRKPFAHEMSKRAHEMTHTRSKSFTCKFCYKTFCHFSSKQAHERNHKGSKSYACGYCGKTFSLRMHKRAHELRHKRRKRYRCNYCKKKFRTTRAHQKHETIHLIKWGHEANQSKEYLSGVQSEKTTLHPLMVVNKVSLPCVPPQTASHLPLEQKEVSHPQTQPKMITPLLLKQNNITPRSSVQAKPVMYSILKPRSPTDKWPLSYVPSNPPSDLPLKQIDENPHLSVRPEKPAILLLNQSHDKDKKKTFKSIKENQKKPHRCAQYVGMVEENPTSRLPNAHNHIHSLWDEDDDDKVVFTPTKNLKTYKRR